MSIFKVFTRAGGIYPLYPLAFEVPEEEYSEPVKTLLSEVSWAVGRYGALVGTYSKGEDGYSLLSVLGAEPFPDVVPQRLPLDSTVAILEDYHLIRMPGRHQPEGLVGLARPDGVSICVPAVFIADGEPLFAAEYADLVGRWLKEGAGPVCVYQLRLDMYTLVRVELPPTATFCDAPKTLRLNHPFHEVQAPTVTNAPTLHS